MNRVARKVFVHSQEIERTRVNILRWNVVSEVNDLDRGIRGKDYSFHRPNKKILRAEVGKEGDYHCQLPIADCRFLIGSYEWLWYFASLKVGESRIRKQSAIG